MSKETIKTGASLKEYLKNIIETSVKSSLHQKALEEKDKQQALAPSTPSENVSATTSKTMDSDVDDALKKGEVSLDDIIEKLNSIRSGKSFKDDSIHTTMEEYVESLSKAEKTALLAFLKAISQIVTGEIPAQDVIDPSEPPAKVKMQKGSTQQTKHIKPNVIKTQTPSKTAEKNAKEDTTAPVPITPKR